LIIYGYSKTAKELAYILKEKGKEFTIISYQQREVDEALLDGYDAKLSDLSSDFELKDIGIGKIISTLFCMDKDYNKNLFVTLSARNLDPNLSIISLVSTLNEESKMKLAGASHVVNPYDLGSHRAYRLIRKPKVFDVLDSMIFQNLDTKIDEVKVSKNSSVIDVEFQKLTIEKDYNLLLIGVESKKSGKFYYNTHRVYRKIREDDIFVVAGSEDEIERFKRELV
jgi:voltage-gated potassium channel